MSWQRTSSLHLSVHLDMAEVHHETYNPHSVCTRLSDGKQRNLS